LFYLLESSLQCLAENPENLFDFKLAPARKMLEKLPVTWDETIVLPGSKIGVIAAMARRKKDVWYVAVINGTTENYEFVTELEFLKPNTNYLATSVTDETNGSLYEHTSVINKKDKSVFKLLPAGGLLIRIKPLGKPQRINRIKKIK
jgi:alpha-glucosidase